MKLAVLVHMALILSEQIWRYSSDFLSHVWMWSERRTFLLPPEAPVPLGKSPLEEVQQESRCDKAPGRKPHPRCCPPEQAIVCEVRFCLPPSLVKPVVVVVV